MILCKDAENKVGLRVKSINKGVFVCLVTKGSPAAMGGLRFGDQVTSTAELESLYQVILPWFVKHYSGSLFH